MEWINQSVSQLSNIVYLIILHCTPLPSCRLLLHSLCCEGIPYENAEIKFPTAGYPELWKVPSSGVGQNIDLASRASPTASNSEFWFLSSWVMEAPTPTPTPVRSRRKSTYDMSREADVLLVMYKKVSPWYDLSLLEWATADEEVKTILIWEPKTIKGCPFKAWSRSEYIAMNSLLTSKTFSPSTFPVHSARFFFRILFLVFHCVRCVSHSFLCGPTE